MLRWCLRLRFLIAHVLFDDHLRYFRIHNLWRCYLLIHVQILFEYPRDLLIIIVFVFLLHIQLILLPWIHSTSSCLILTMFQPWLWLHFEYLVGGWTSQDAVILNTQIDITTLIYRCCLFRLSLVWTINHMPLFAHAGVHAHSMLDALVHSVAAAGWERIISLYRYV